MAVAAALRHNGAGGCDYAGAGGREAIEVSRVVWGNKGAPGGRLLKDDIRVDRNLWGNKTLNLKPVLRRTIEGGKRAHPWAARC